MSVRSGLAVRGGGDKEVNCRGRLEDGGGGVNDMPNDDNQCQRDVGILQDKSVFFLHSIDQAAEPFIKFSLVDFWFHVSDINISSCLI